MVSGFRVLVVLLALASVACGARALPQDGTAAAPQASDGWRCPPCGHADDEKVYDAPGPCPVCGMGMVSVLTGRTEGGVKVAVLLFDGAQPIDFAGPWEVFGGAGFDVFSVSDSGQQITSVFGMKLTPDYGFADCPAADVVLVPGGSVGAPRKNAVLLDWLRRRAADSDHVLSVCTGAFVLGEAGLLDGLEATTVRGGLDALGESFPKATVVRGTRFTDNGRILTSAGLSAGIDAALHLVGELKGQETARGVADAMEYAWNPGENRALPRAKKPKAAPR